MPTATTQSGKSMPEKLPFLEASCWQTENVHLFDRKEILSRYERGWIQHQVINIYVLFDI